MKRNLRYQITNEGLCALTTNRCSQVAELILFRPSAYLPLLEADAWQPNLTRANGHRRSQPPSNGSRLLLAVG
jgi:hypothetical protein